MKNTKHSPSRRILLLSMLSLPLAGITLPTWARIIIPSLHTQLAELEKSANGRLGLALINTADGQSVQYRGDERFAFCSTFKLILVAAILHKSMSQPNLLEKHITYSEADLLSYAPITRKNLSKGMSITQLSAATLQYSDNTAANLLIKELGGLDAVNLFAKRSGDKVFWLNRWEPDLNTAIPNDPRDTTTPNTMAAAVEKIVLGDILAAPQRAQLVTWLKGNTTGAESISAGVPNDWIVGDKTGSGDYGTSNDVAVIWPPTGAPLVLAVFFTQHQKDAKSRKDVLASATRIVMKHLRK